jgi:hypothetical protein
MILFRNQIRNILSERVRAAKVLLLISYRVCRGEGFGVLLARVVLCHRFDIL